MSDREWQIEMLWQCSTCPPKHENLGRHKECQNCGAPKKESDEFYMPGDVRYEARVTDQSRVEDALAGPDWSCKYCGSAQRRNDGECARCGVSQTEGVQRRPTITPPPRINPQHPFRSPGVIEEEPEPEAPVSTTSIPRRRSFSLTPVFVAIGVVALVLCLYLLLRTREVDARVSSVTWTHVVSIERYQSVPEDGFDPPSDATDVHNLGPRWHHNDRVPNGSHTERYTVREACGETCVPIPKSCRDVCSNNKNGYASCKEVCSGGGQSCSTKYCDVSKTRRVQDYRDEPVYHSYYSWHVWRWRHNRNVQTSGSTLKTNWPSESPPSPLASGEQERSARKASYVVIFAQGKDTWAYSPSSLDEFERYEEGKSFHIKVNMVGVQVVNNRQ